MIFLCILTLNQGYVTPSFEFAHNKKFKSDLQRLALSLQASLVCMAQWFS